MWSLPHTTGDYQTNPILIKPAWKSGGNEPKNEANRRGGVVRGAGKPFMGEKRAQSVVRMRNQKDSCNGAGKAVQERAIRACPDGWVEMEAAGGLGRG
jgi:hypothetical protein